MKNIKIYMLFIVILPLFSCGLTPKSLKRDASGIDSYYITAPRKNKVYMLSTIHFLG
ncbi:hypothetical protein [Treponema sp. R6D11]